MQDREQPPVKLSKLEIKAEKEENNYEFSYTVFCLECNMQLPTIANERVAQAVEAVKQTISSAQASEVQAWSLELTSCEHILTLQQDKSDNFKLGGKCGECDLQKNLWLCMECGHLGCGRKQFGNEELSGNGHGLDHYNETGHGVNVKLGSITPEGTADIYCYKCDEERLDPDLETHLATWDINLKSQSKTEKSLTELNVEQNIKYDFSMTDEKGQKFMPVFGRGLTGLKNLGNSCYLSSVVQTLFDLDTFESRFLPEFEKHANLCTVPIPADCMECQLNKLADGLLSGRYCIPDAETKERILTGEDPEGIKFQQGLKPSMFKYLIGKGHPEFATMRQQDASEFLLYLLKVLSRLKTPAGRMDPTEEFRFLLEERLQCLGCKKSRYQVIEQDNLSISLPDHITKQYTDNSEEKASSVTLDDCFSSFFAEEEIDFTCPSCQSNKFSKRTRLRTLPSKLLLTVRKFALVNWVPTKLNISLDLSKNGSLSLQRFVVQEPSADEPLLPEDKNVSELKFSANPEAMIALESMGFPRTRCIKALKATGNSDVEAATNWIFGHMDDPDIDIDNETDVNDQQTEVDPQVVSTLLEMGFSDTQARFALKQTGNNSERAIDWLFSHPEETGEGANETDSQVRPAPSSRDLNSEYKLRSAICHKGAGVHSGHYVAFIDKGIKDTTETRDISSWVLFNDEKVIEQSEDLVKEAIRTAYTYVFV